MAMAGPRELEIPSRLWPEEQRADWRVTHMVNKVSVDPAGSNYTYGETTINWGFNLDKGIYRKYKNHDLKLIFLVRNQNENTLYYVIYYLSWKYESVDKKAWHQSWLLGFSSHDPHGRSKELSPTGWHLVFTCASRPIHLTKKQIIKK